MSKWSVKNLPRLDGKVALVTGATGGLGFETALELAGAGAEVVLSGRNAQKGADALAAIRRRYPGVRISFEQADLSDLRSVAAMAARVAAAHPALDILVNNAGVMALPARQITADGFEMQFGTNYLSHFALTGHLLGNLRRAPSPRVVQLSSLAHRRGRIAFDDLQARNYSAWPVYSQSKLAMLMFALELQRRSDRNGWGLVSNAAHPGWARTDLIANGPTSGGRFWMRPITGLATLLMFQDAAAGALPTLFAAAAPEAKGGAYYGPDGAGERTGAPKEAIISEAAADGLAASRLFDVSETLTGIAFPRAALAA
jgi:NAD(P)-dependent dehydrogenase (short-subunit alcohol dehydrogenase family)